MKGEVRVNDVGTEIEVAVTSAGEVLDISSATVKQFIFKKPGSSTLETVDAAFSTDGADGVLVYRTPDGFLDRPGTWKLQVYLEIGSWKGRSTPAIFEVYSNL